MTRVRKQEKGARRSPQQNSLLPVELPEWDCFGDGGGVCEKNLGGRGQQGNLNIGSEGHIPCTVMTKITRESTRQNASARKHATKEYKEERFMSTSPA